LFSVHLKSEGGRGVMKISRHKLAKESARFEEVAKTSGEFGEGLPDTIVIHYTAGPTAESAINTFKDPAVKASAHIVIDLDGSITQLIPFNKIAWHAGESSWLDRNRLNPYSIGIEIVNAGRLEKSGDRWRAWFGRTYGEEDVVKAVHRNEKRETWWHRFTEEQITATMELCKEIMNHYKIRYILGHEEISPGRKIDPGPAFPLDKIRDRLLYPDRSDENQKQKIAAETGRVNTAGLNIRSGPGTSHETVMSPLSRGTELSILDEKDGWYMVEVPVKGWVSKRFIEKL
jgi:N-acetylmuramoyl-L-alanine amidase